MTNRIGQKDLHRPVEMCHASHVNAITQWTQLYHLIKLTISEVYEKMNVWWITFLYVDSEVFLLCFVSASNELIMS